jgi:ribonuclease HI
MSNNPAPIKNIQLERTASPVKVARVEIYTDGGCFPNPGNGGWGVLLRYKGHEKELSGSERNTTNNRMEMSAAIQGLQALKRPSVVTVYSDSQYLIKGITSWIHKWKKQNWRLGTDSPIKNVDLWCELDRLVSLQLSVEWQWIRGHNGHKDNERVDYLAGQAIYNIPESLVDTVCHASLPDPVLSITAPDMFTAPTPAPRHKSVPVLNAQPLPKPQASKKKKRAKTKKSKWYAVWVGRYTGVFSSWPACQEAINHYPQAVYRSYPTEAAAKEAYGDWREMVTASPVTTKQVVKKEEPKISTEVHRRFAVS